MRKGLCMVGGPRLLVFTVLLVTLCALVFHIGQATAWNKQPTLSAVASVFAMRPVNVRCYNSTEDGSPALERAWGYVKTPLWRARYTAIDGRLCDAALTINDPSIDRFYRALGVLVLIHESYHLRKWGAAGNEAKVECQAIRHWKVGARLLGATESTLEDLWPMALAQHAEITRIVEYDDPSCRVPPLVDFP